MKITLKDGSVFEGTAQEYAELAKLVEGIAETKDEYVPKVGDKVRALADSEFRDVRKGEIGVVTSVDAACGDSDKYSIAVKTEEERCYFRPQDLELVAVEDKEEKSLKVGDYVVALPTADERYSITNSEMRLGKVKDVQGDLINIEILEHSRSKAFVGEELFALSKYFRKATDEEVAKIKNEYIPEEGEVVVITGNTNGSINKVGDVGRVGERLGNKGVQVHVPGKPNGLLGGNYTKFDEMRPATEEEKQQYEQAEKFAKLGRKPGEFKKGDIFKGVGGRISQGLFEVVEIREEGSHPIRFINRDGENDGFSLKAELELIAPVESRVDRVD